MPDPLSFVLSLLEQKGPVKGDSMEDKMAYRYLDQGHIDSFGLIHFIMELEDQFSISLTPEDTQSDQFRTVGGLAQLIQTKMSA